MLFFHLGNIISSDNLTIPCLRKPYLQQLQHIYNLNTLNVCMNSFATYLQFEYLECLLEFYYIPNFFQFVNYEFDIENLKHMLSDVIVRVHPHKAELG